MASNDIEELVLKVSVDVNEDELKKLRDDMKKFQEEAAKTKLNLVDQSQIDKLKEEISKLRENAHSILGDSNMPFNDPSSDRSGAKKGPGYVPKESTYRPSSNGAGLTVPLSSDQTLEVLRKIEQEQNESLMIQKKDDQRKGKTTDEEKRKKEEGGGFSEGLSTAHGIADQSLATSAGGLLGGVIGAIAAGPVGAAAGASIGASIVSLVEKIAGNINEAVTQISEKFDKQLSEDMQFRQVHQTTGMATKQIYELGVQARLAGTSLQTVVDSNQRLSDELITGMSDTKTQLLMALNINPRTAITEAGGDPAKLNEMMFHRALSATMGYPAATQTSILKGLGYNEKEQDWRRYIYRSDYRDKAGEAYNAASQNGANPIHEGEQLHQDILAFRGALEVMNATNRSLLTKDNLAQKLSIGLATIHTGITKIIIGAIDKIEGGTFVPTSSVNKTKIDTVQKTVSDNERMRQEIFDRLHPNTHNAPASDSGSNRSASAGGG